jgi:MFS family permease
MFSQGGLSLDQAPPLSVVFRFFITASIFGVLLGLFLLLDNLSLLPSLSHGKELFITHILALGVMASFMLGALFQMLPVIAGVSIKTPTKKVFMVHVLFIVGFLIQLYAFLDSSIPLLYFLSSAYLGAGLLYAMVFMLKELIKIKDHSSSSKGMVFSLVSFTLAIVLGIYLLLTLGGYIDGVLFTKVKELHYSFALFGWVSLLIVSVSFQVVEMFYVTPKYPPFMSKYLTLSIFTLLLLKSIAIFMLFKTELITAFLIILFMVYAGVTLHRLYHRKRPTSDATVWFWRLGMGLLMVSMFITLLDTFIDITLEVKMLSYVTFIGFALSIVFAMVYKIVPFLTWFHLSNQGYMEAPMMHDVIHPKKAKKQFYIYVAMLTFLMISLFVNIPIIDILASFLVIISFGWLLYNLIYAMKEYNDTQKHTQKIEW